MRLEVRRISFKQDYTIGQLYINGQYFCDTLEDVPREIKIPGVTAIPVGTYRMKLTWSNRFERIMPLICDVPGFVGVRIHAGNTPADTEGCILVGDNLSKGILVNSRIRFEKLMDMLMTGDNLSITIT